MRALLMLLPLLLLLQLGLIHAVTVETTYGTVEGQTLTLVDQWHEGIEINSFYGIPFATPPVGDLRFTIPTPPEPWDDVFVADSPSTACMQYLTALDWTNPGWRDYDEDCLHLNIFAPADPTGGPYPVFFWIYGGAYYMGANVQYMGHFLAAHDVVVVIPNYRLEIFGFGYSGDDEIPGNMGLWDQRLALQFVQDNIAAFGGDPDQVTIGGQSAGATSVGQHIMSPQSTGLFHQAILQSGSDLSHWGTNGPFQNPENYTFEAAERLDCPIEDTAEMTECLRELSATELRTGFFFCEEGYFCMGFAPVVDGPGGFTPDIPHVLRESGDFNEVGELIGYNHHDGFTFAASLGPEMIVGPGPDREAFIRILGDVADFLSPRLDEGRRDDLHAAMIYYYTPWPYLDDGALNKHMIGMASTDTGYGYSDDWQARYQSQVAPVYYYIFGYTSENNPVDDWLGTSHSFELPFTFGYNFLRHNPAVREETGIADFYDYDDLDDEWGYFMVTLWANYVKFGNPTPTPVQPPGDHDPIDWPMFNTDTYAYVYLGDGAEDQTMGDSVLYRQHANAFWREYVPYLFGSKDE